MSKKHVFRLFQEIKPLICSAWIGKSTPTLPLDLAIQREQLGKSFPWKVLIRPLIISTVLMLQATPVPAHDAFYPHHREDFDAITRRQEFRGTVLIITAGFISLLAGVLYMALRKSGEVDPHHHQTMQAHLENATNQAGVVAQTGLANGGTPAEAIGAALAAYAKASGVAWNPNPAIVTGNTIRCRIGKDIVIIKIFEQKGSYQIEVNATCEAAQWTVTKFVESHTSV
jgi:hypothetical protein